MSPLVVSGLLMGLFGGAHCVVMCGGVSSVICAGGTKGRFAIAYNAGRIASYAVLGLIVGTIGSVSVGLPLDVVRFVLRTLAARRLPGSSATLRVHRRDGAGGRLEATIGTANLADLLFVRGASAPLSMSKETVRLAPIRGRVAGGEVTGDVTVHLRSGFRYVAHLEVRGAEVKTLLSEAKSAGRLTGTLGAGAAFEGRGGLRIAQV